MVIFYLIAAGSAPKNESVSHSLSWNLEIITILAMVSIHMGNMIDHSSWLMFWLGGSRLCVVSTYMPKYLPTLCSEDQFLSFCLWLVWGTMFKFPYEIEPAGIWQGNDPWVQIDDLG